MSCSPAFDDTIELAGRVIAYLSEGEALHLFKGHSWCRLRCGIPDADLGAADMGDGVYMWPEGLPHYLEAHDVKPPESFLEHVRRRDGLSEGGRSEMKTRASRQNRAVTATRGSMATPLDARRHFDDMGGRVWLDAAHQGPLPLTAAERAREAIRWKLAPYEMTPARFVELPARVRELAGQLIGAPADEVIVANGASYGLHLLANGLPLAAGDEVLLMRGDFPANLYPWLALRKRGVRVTLLEPADRVLSVDEIAAAITPATRALCLTWVHSLSGWAIEADAIGALCRDRGVWFLLNATQGIGARPLSVASMPVDAVLCSAWKWLLGPYGTGFAWLRPALLDLLEHNQAYWLALAGQQYLSGGGGGELTIRDDIGARRYDVFGTASFFNLAPLTAALELILELGVDRIAAHDQALVDRLVAGLDRARCDLLSPAAGPARSTLVFFSAKHPAHNAALHDRLSSTGIHIAHRAGAMRASPHLYNTEADIDRLLDVLAAR